ncbi:hypothetical protein PGH26_09005 [Sporosarcina jeotgali]|uniref:YneQ n=1 Tax=Sporosarcina jeotgali TaxID=3020056 RepID=A0ABZ0KW38_9BACL|nr:hypothetical protein [Sporosarcina sp. B2O-1]WOV83074.1 hypothetical protein PGH26_09005 [Sporosarcina sp. B2O-1]
MAFGTNRTELRAWKEAVRAGEIAFLTHYWIDDRFPGCNTVTKVGCADIDLLMEWGQTYGLKPEWIDYKKDYPHFDLFGKIEVEALLDAGLADRVERFNLKKKIEE